MQEVLNLDLQTVQSLWASITAIEAQEMLNGITVSCYPNMKKDAKQRKHAELYRLANPAPESRRALTWEQVSAMMNKGK